MHWKLEIDCTALWLCLQRLNPACSLQHRMMGGEGIENGQDNVEGTSEVPASLQPLRASLFEPDAVARLQSDYKVSTPYRHLVIPDLMDDAVLRTACEELKTNMQATLKETDIFKVWC